MASDTRVYLPFFVNLVAEGLIGIKLSLHLGLEQDDPSANPFEHSFRFRVPSFLFLPFHIWTMPFYFSIVVK